MCLLQDEHNHTQKGKSENIQWSNLRDFSKNSGPFALFIYLRNSYKSSTVATYPW